MSFLPSLMPVTDAMFLIPESREQPMHIGSLQLFRPPAGAGPDFLTDLYNQALATTNLAPQFRKRPVRTWSSGRQWAWEDDNQIDLEHHVRHSALPRPGRIRELLALTSRLHSTPLDRQRPLWEAHLIEGLEDGRFAVYTKLHHAVMDGVSASRLIESSLSTDPNKTDTPMPFAERPRKARQKPGFSLASLVSTGVSAAGDVVGLAPHLLSVAHDAIRQTGGPLPGQAPRTMLNVPITGSRRFAADAWDLERMRAVAKGADATLNDVVLAMSSAALRAYLIAQDALPSQPLIAMAPVSLRTEEAKDDGGNAVGAILCNLGTHLADPEERMITVRDSMGQGKAGLASLSPLQVSALSAVTMSPILLYGVLGVPPLLPPPFNIVISNVPGPRKPLYWNGARLEGSYPLSIPTAGQAVNITCSSYDGKMAFGLVGCRRSLPHLQTLLVGLEDGLAGLEKAFL
ncbi:MAG: Acyltransferase [Frankiales bacterium]|nr:Acyltransferase [Frankiales bacterium]